MQLLIGCLWGLSVPVALIHGVAAGLMVPVIADAWINILYWRGCHYQAQIFKVSRNRRESDADRTGELERL